MHNNAPGTTQCSHSISIVTCSKGGRSSLSRSSGGSFFTSVRFFRSRLIISRDNAPSNFILLDLSFCNDDQKLSISHRYQTSISCIDSAQTGNFAHKFTAGSKKHFITADLEHARAVTNIRSCATTTIG